MPPDYESCRLDTGELLKVLTGLIAAASVISILFYNSLIPAISAIVLLIPVRRAAEKQKAQKKKDQVVNAFRDVCFCIASSFATGRHMPESLREAEEEMKRIIKKQQEYIDVHVYDPISANHFMEMGLETDSCQDPIPEEYDSLVMQDEDIGSAIMGIHNKSAEHESGIVA